MRLSIACCDHLKARTLERSGNTIEFLASRVVRSLHLKKTRRAGRATMNDAAAKNITGLRYEDDRRM